MGRSDVLACWFGESDEPTPLEVRQTEGGSLTRGETFESHNLGPPGLREGLAACTNALHGPVGVDRIAVTPATRVLLVNAPNNPSGWALGL